MTKEEREKAISALKMSTPIMALTPNEFDDYIKTLNNLMDWLEQEPKTGHWIWQKEDIYRCSECGNDIRVKEVMYVPQYVCCPMCETKMQAESEDKE